MGSCIYNLFLYIGVFLIFLQAGNALKCNVGLCQNFTGDVPPNLARYNCPHPMAEVTCPPLPGGIPADRCMTMRMKMKLPNPLSGGTYEVISDSRNCTSSFGCTSAVRELACKNANATGYLESCEMGCCQGDLCNSGGPIPTFAPQPTGPSVSNLSCYSCSSMPIPGVVTANAPCSSPAKQICGNVGFIPGMKQDRCIRISLKVNGIQLEMRNCSNSFACNKEAICKQLSSLGSVSNCDVSCCFGKLCNTDSRNTTDRPSTTDRPNTDSHNTTESPNTDSHNTDDNTVDPNSSSGILSASLLFVFFIVGITSFIAQ